MKILIAVLAVAAIGVGCRDPQPVEVAASGGLPSLTIPVGPIPGPGVEMLPANPYADNPVARVDGRRLFVQYNCSGCHGGHGGGGMGPSLRDPYWRYGSAPAHVFASIAQGRGRGMPAWGTKIPAEQIWKIVAYIKSMRTAQEPDPPTLTPQPEVKTPPLMPTHNTGVPR